MLFVYFSGSWIFCAHFRKKKKHSNTRFHQSPSSWSQAVSCRRTDGRTDMTKLTVAFRNFAKAPKNEKLSPSKRWMTTGGSRSTAPRIPNVGTCGHLSDPGPRYLGYPLNRTLDGLQKWCGRPLHLPVIETSIVQPVTWSTPTAQLAKLAVIK